MNVMELGKESRMTLGLWLARNVMTMLLTEIGSMVE